MIVVNRFRVPLGEQAEFRERLEGVRAVLASKPGFVDATIGRNVDEPDLWVLSSRWADVGSYRRALSSYDGKLHVAPLLGRAVQEPSAYEVVEPGADLNVAAARSLG